MLDRDQCETMNISPQNTSPHLWESVLRSTFVRVDSGNQQHPFSLHISDSLPAKECPVQHIPRTHWATASPPQPRNPWFSGTEFLASVELFIQLNYQGSSLYQFAWAASNCPPLPSYPVLWNLQCLFWETWLKGVIWSKNAPKQERAVADRKTLRSARITFWRTSQKG